MVAGDLQDPRKTARWHNVYLCTSITFLTSTIVFMSLYFADSCSTTAPTAPIYNTSITVEDVATSSRVINIPNCLTLSTSTVGYGYACAINLGPTNMNSLYSRLNDYLSFSIEHFERIGSIISLSYPFGTYANKNMIQCCCGGTSYTNPSLTAGYESANDFCKVDQNNMPINCGSSSLISKDPRAMCRNDGVGIDNEPAWNEYQISPVMKILQTNAKITCNSNLGSNPVGWEGTTKFIDYNMYLIMSCSF